jgi:hypothetical protein
MVAGFVEIGESLEDAVREPGATPNRSSRSIELGEQLRRI